MLRGKTQQACKEYISTTPAIRKTGIDIGDGSSSCDRIVEPATLMALWECSVHPGWQRHAPCVSTGGGFICYIIEKADLICSGGGSLWDEVTHGHGSVVTCSTDCALWVVGLLLMDLRD